MKKIGLVICLVLVSVFTANFAVGCSGTAQVVDDRGVVVEGSKVYIGEYSEKQLIKVDFFDVGYGKDWIYEAAKDFVYENQEYALYLSADSSLVTNMENKLTTGKNLSDLYFSPHFNWELFVSQDALVPLDDVFAAKPDGEDGKTFEGKMDDSYIEGCVMEKDGVQHYYVVPWTKLITGIAYNSDLFEKYGIEVPTTMAEFSEVCDTIIAESTAEGKRIAPFVVPGKIGGYFDFLGMNWWIQASGLDTVKEFFAYQTVEVFNPAKEPYSGFVRALEEFEKYFGLSSGGFEKYCLSGSMAKDAYSAQRDFINGEAAMIINADWLEREMISLVEETEFNMKLMRVPYLDDAVKENGEYVAVNYAADANFACIPSKAKNIEGAKEFLIFLCKESQLQSFTKITGALRPFEYDYDSLRSELSEFANSVLDINDICTENFYDLATGPRRFKAQKFILANPYTSIVNGQSPAEFAAQEYAEAKVRWDNDWAV